MTIGDRIKQIRLERGLSQEQFGHEVNLATNSISKVERGALVLSEKTLRSICSYYKINYDWMITGNGEKTTGPIYQIKKQGIPERIRGLRKRYGLTQEEFGESIGVTRYTIYGIEGEKANPSNTLLKAISDKYGCSYEWLLSGEISPLSEEEQLEVKELSEKLFRFFLDVGEDGGEKVLLKVMQSDKKLIPAVRRLVQMIDAVKEE